AGPAAVIASTTSNNPPTIASTENTTVLTGPTQTNTTEPNTGPTSTQSGPSASGAAAASTATDLASTPTRGNDFTIQRPGGHWIIDHHELRKTGYIETRWHLAGDPSVIFLVDHTPGFKGTARQGAESVSGLFTHIASYHELGFAADKLPAGKAWRWEYEVHGTHSIDTFLMSCDTGYAARGAAPSAQWARYAKSFENAIATLTPVCV
ncbi:MAG TPA: hypothetical protein VGI76_00745, partial [Solirubrobacteraceae bacterium]